MNSTVGLHNYYAEYNIKLLTVEGEMFNILIVISPVSERSLILS